VKVRSLSTELLVSVSVLLVVFFGVTIVALDFVFRDVVETSMRDRLSIQVGALISASQEDENHTALAPEDEFQKAQTRFNSPGSGLYGEIRLNRGPQTWRSKSAAGTGITFPADMKLNERRVQELRLNDGSPVLALSYCVEWQFDDGNSAGFIYSVAENLDQYHAQLTRFRVNLFGGFGILITVLLVSFAFLFRRVLLPLRRIEQEIEQIEAGTLAEVGGGYPRELLGVTANLNALLRSERERLARYRNSLGNLAHSLKTPLAVMRNALGSGASRELPSAKQLDEQVTRMDDIVRYQLKRAAASGGLGLGAAPVDVAQVLEALRGALMKVYIERNLDCEVIVAPGSVFTGDREDFTEIAGNLLDNACKFGRHRVRVSAGPLEGTAHRRPGLMLAVEDDGPGVPVEDRQRVLERGARLDERVSGQGIGLSVVRELVEVYGGTAEIDQSALGGARITIRFPGI
jgi:two-component system, OmpR family, sensor histidine kinase PhoQ